MKAHRLKKGDTIAIVSLSSGSLGEPYCAHELELAEKRLTAYGFQMKLMPNALKGREYLDAHPEKRAQDLLDAFRDREAKAILCAIGGDDTYRLAPFLMEGELEQAVRENPKIFLGFSDTTVNHLMLHRCGLNTFYGQALLPDIAELDKEMLPYSRQAFEQLFLEGTIKDITPSPVWYEDRTDFSPAALGTPRIAHQDSKGFEILSGAGQFSGALLGGCVESLSDMLTGNRYGEEKALVEKYGLFPAPEEWEGKILLLETSEEQPEPESLRNMLHAIRSAGVFDKVSGVLIGKPMDEKYYEEYKAVYREAIGNPALSLVYNVNIGHAAPRCILPLGIMTQVDAKENKIRFLEDILEP